MFMPGDHVKFFGYPARVERDKFISVTAKTATVMTGRKERAGYDRAFTAPTGETFWLVRSMWNDRAAFHVVGAHYAHITN